MSGKINHRHVTAYTDDPTADVSADEWNDSFVVSEGVNGQFMVRDVGSPDGWSLHTFTVSDLPPSSSLPVASVVASDYVAIGSNPAQTGALRLASTGRIYSRNPTNTADVLMIGNDGAGSIYLGDPATVAIKSGAGDNLLDLGAVGYRWRNVYAGTAAIVGSYVAIGTNPAQAGALRLANNAAVMARNNANLTDASLIKLNASQYVVLADQAVTNGVLIDNAYLRWLGTTSATPALRASGAELQVLLGDASDYGTIRAKLFIGATSAGSGLQLPSSTAFVSIGSAPASSGAIRLPYDGYIYVRNSTNTGDTVALGVFTDTVFITSSGVPNLVPGSGDGAGALGKSTNRWSAAYVSGFVAIGTNPAQTGAIRMANNDGIFARNAANTADIRMLRVNSSDFVVVGVATNGLLLNGSSVLYGPIYMEFSEMTAPAAPGANSVRFYAEDNGAGKTRLMAIFPSGAAQQIAIEP